MHADRKARLISTLQSEDHSGRLPGAVVMLSRHGKVELFESIWDNKTLKMQRPWPWIPFSAFIP